MNKLLHILSMGMSIICYPLLMPMYGMLFYFLALKDITTYLPIYWIIAFAGTFFFTILIPLSLILLMLHRKQISSIYIENSNERTMPYIYTLCCYAFWCYFLSGVLHVAKVFFWSAIGASVALLVVTVINSRWKISAHLCGLGGLIGGMVAYMMTAGYLPSTLFVCLILLVALLLMYARLYLKAHTDIQVVAGFLLGLILTFLPSLFLYA